MEHQQDIYFLSPSLKEKRAHNLHDRIHLNLLHLSQESSKFFSNYLKTTKHDLQEVKGDCKS